MFCQQCGKSLSDNAKFCDSCGTSLGGSPAPGGPSQPQYAAPAQPQYAPPPQYQAGNQNVPYGAQPVPAGGYGYAPMPQKSLGLALILSLIIPGIGQMYVSKFGRGVAFLVGIVVLWIIDGVIWAAAWTSAWNYYYYTPVYDPTIAAIAGLFVILIIGFHIFAAYDAYKLAKQYNGAAYQTGRAPW